LFSYVAFTHEYIVCRVAVRELYVLQ
jgi:hypothetical protein